MNLEFTPAEHDAINTWIKEKHRECAKKYTGAIGGHFEYWACPTSLGAIYGVRCLVCDTEALDLTNYDLW